MDPWQFSIRTLLGGAGTDYAFAGPIGGLGIPAPRPQGDQERGDLDGDVGGDDVLTRRILTLPIGIDGTSPSDTMVLFQALKAAWRPSTVDLELALCLPGFPTTDETLVFFGRPRGFDGDLARLKSSRADALLTFEALDPFGYGAAETVALAVGANVVDVDGDAVTDRWTLELTASASSVVIANADDDEPNLSLSDAAGTILLDGRGHNIDGTAELVPGYGWPTLVPGTNTITLTGGAGDLTYRPAYH